MKVYKFGGTSVGTAQRMQRIVEIIRQEKKVFVVLSAMSGTTDTLSAIGQNIRTGKKEDALTILHSLQNNYQQTLTDLFTSTDEIAEAYVGKSFEKITNLIHEPYDPFAEKMLIAIGEQLSTFLFYRLLTVQKFNATLLDSTTLIHLDKEGEPVIHHIRQQINESLKGHPGSQIYIAQGFICSDYTGNISNLGRGGSDYSASLFGAALEAEEIQIWTDIDGVQNNDPRFVDQTQPIRQLHFDEAAELAYFGAKILHPLCVLPAQNAGIPVLLKNTLQPADPGTRISAAGQGRGFKAVAARDHITAIRIKSSRMLMAYGFLRKVFEIFEEFKTPIDMITTSEVAVSITIDDNRHLEEIVEHLKKYGHVEVAGNKTIVGVVGLVDADDPGYAMRLFGALSDIPIRMISYGASAHNVSFLINTEDKIRTLKALHNGLFQL